MPMVFSNQEFGHQLCPQEAIPLYLSFLTRGRLTPL